MEPAASRRPGRGFSLLEVVLAVAIVAVAVVPVVTMYLQQGRSAAFDDYNRMARCRARRLVETLAALEYDALKALPPPSPAAPAEVVEAAAAGLGSSARPVAVLLPPREVELEKLTVEHPLSPPYARYLKACARYAEGAWFEELDPDGLGQIVACVTWRVPGERAAQRPHLFRYATFVSRRDRSFTRPPAAPALAAAGS